MDLTLTPAEKSKLTPLMQQYFEIKTQFQDALILFQVGDFYEIFFDDAKTASKELAITLTSRGNFASEPIPLCGVPKHAADFYIIKLAKLGYKVVICDQLEDAQQGKLVRRGVSRVITPGTMTDAALLNEKKSSYLMVLTPQEDKCSIVVAELLTGLLYSTNISLDYNFKYLQAELVRFTPDEIIIADSKEANSTLKACKLAGYMATLLREDAPTSEIENSYQEWQKKFNEPVVPALYSFYRYMHKYQPDALEQFSQLKYYKPQDYLYLDAATQKTLEITQNLQGDKTGTLFEAVDKTVTLMGARLLRQWLTHPLKDLQAILARQSGVQYFVENIISKDNLRSIFKKLPDVERVVGRCLLLKGNYHDYQALKDSAEVSQKVVDIFTYMPEYLAATINMIGDFQPLVEYLDLAIDQDKIGSGFDLELDNLRNELEELTNKILEFENNERLSTGISSLKVVYNQVHGYLIEITKTNLGAVPGYYEPYQKLSGRERFIVTELKALEQAINRVKKQIEQLEVELMQKIKAAVLDYARPLRLLARAYARLDVVSALAHLASTNSYCCPQVTKNPDLIIQAGRHPVLENMGVRFVPNNLNFDDSCRTAIITGPNMGGKSTYLRQSALILLLAHVGSFVPAKAAQIPLSDMICTRIGSGDNLKEGKSTFFVEMEETAQICNFATSKTLVVLDEVGRGTSTQDGVAIAQAVVEYLHKKGCMLMFATHYQELTKLEKLVGIKNFHVMVDQSGAEVVFLHSIAPGVSESSFGVEVAKMSGMPLEVVQRAKEIISF